MKIKALIIVIILASCSNNNELILDVEIKDLKKGKLVLTKHNDSVFQSIDSFNVNGQKNIVFKHELNEPQFLFLNLFTNESYEPLSLSFFAEKGQIKLVTSLEKYGYELKVTGSKNDSIYRKYLKLNKKFNDEKVDLIKKSFEKRKSQENDSVIIIDDLLLKLNKRQFLHNANYVIRNKNYEISPYLAITDLKDSKIILDTVYKSLSDKVLKSKYSLILKSLL
jgi:hypothetical protein